MLGLLSTLYLFIYVFVCLCISHYFTEEGRAWIVLLFLHQTVKALLDFSHSSLHTQGTLTDEQRQLRPWQSSCMFCLLLGMPPSLVGPIRSGIPDLVRIWTQVPKVVRNRSGIGH